MVHGCFRTYDFKLIRLNFPVDEFCLNILARRFVWITNSFHTMIGIVSVSLMKYGREWANGCQTLAGGSTYYSCQCFDIHGHVISFPAFLLVFLVKVVDNTHFTRLQQTYSSESRSEQDLLQTLSPCVYCLCVVFEREVSFTGVLALLGLWEKKNRESKET